MRGRGFEVTRRTLSKLLLGLPFAAASLAEESKPEDKPSPQAECLAAHEPGLSAEETERLRKNIAAGEKSLAVIRAFKLPPDVAPSLRFVAMKSRRK